MKKHLRLISLALFALASLAVFYYFLTELIELARDINQTKPLVVTHDGAYYLLLALLMPYVFVAEIFAPLYKNKALEKLIPYFLFGIVIIGFMLPWALTPLVKGILRDNGYLYCGSLSSLGTKSHFDAWVIDQSLCISSQE